MCALRKRGRLVAKSAMNSLYRSVAAIIVKCIEVAMKPRGGKELASMQRQLHGSCG